MSRRIEIELTSCRDDGSWTWRAAGAREPKGTVEAAILPSGAKVGDVLRAEIDGYLDGMTVVAIVPPRAARAEPERLEIRGVSDDRPLLTTSVTRQRPGDRRRGRGDRERPDRPDRGERRDAGGRRDRPDRGERRDRPERERAGGRGDREGRHRPRDGETGRRERTERPAAPPVEAKPKPKRLRPGRVHRTALLESVPPEQRPIVEQLLQGGIPSVRQAIGKQNDELRAAGKPEVSADQLLSVAEDLRPRAAAAVWRDRAEAALATVDELDLRDLRSVVNAAGDAGRDDEAKALATQLREALTNRIEKEHASWLAELADSLRDGRVVRALRLSSRPPKAGAPIPGDLANQMVAAASAALTDETGQERWATVLEALAFSPLRRRVVPQSLPAKLSPELRATVARLGTRLPEIAHIFAIEPDPSAGRPVRAGARRPAGDRPEGGQRPARRRGGRDRSGPKQPETPTVEAPSATVDETAEQPAPAEPEAPGATTEAAGTSEAPAGDTSPDGRPAAATPESSESADDAAASGDDAPVEQPAGSTFD